jgi:uncharacterized protein (UPF0335 family)
MANKFGGVSGDQLRSIIERVERLEEEKANIAADIREVFAEAKGNGFDTKTIRQVIKLRKMEGNEREEQEYLLDTYLRALGMLPQMDDEEEAA